MTDMDIDTQPAGALHVGGNVFERWANQPEFDYETEFPKAPEPPDFVTLDDLRAMTLAQWHKAPRTKGSRTARYLWEPLADFFNKEGYILFELFGSNEEIPLDRNIRAPDAYHCWIGDPERAPFYCVRNKHCGATRRADGTHVVLHLVAKGDDGHREVAVLRRLHDHPLSTEYKNRCIPVLEWICFEDMLFAVHPLLGLSLIVPKHETVGNALRTTLQCCEAFAYMHSNLVAHLDMGPNEWLLNYGGGRRSKELEFKVGPSNWDWDWEGRPEGPPKYQPFHSRFPTEWTINDFDQAEIYEPDTDPASRMVNRALQRTCANCFEGLCEVLGPPRDKPYCPFKHDVWQLAMALQECLRGFGRRVPEIQRLFDEMTQRLPESRPTMRRVVEQMRLIEARLNLQPDLLEVSLSS